MSSFASLFNKGKKSESVLCVDIGTSSVAGAYVQYREGELPALHYTRRLPIESHKNEPLEKAMFRALQILGEELIREGAPALARATGSGSVHTILVSIDAPWQNTSIHTEQFEQKDPFLFTKNLVAKKLEETRGSTPGKLLVDESIIGTILNGYETSDPYGKKVHRASALVLTSLIDEHIAAGVLSTLRSLYHTKRILPIAGDSLRYQVMRRVFSHERDVLILDATGSVTSIALVRKNLFVAIAEIQDQVTGDSQWVDAVKGELGELAEKYPLPLTIFLLAREPHMASLKEKLNVAKLGELWLSDDPPKIVSVLASHFVGLVHTVTTAPPDILLILMTLYWQDRAPEE